MFSPVNIVQIWRTKFLIYNREKPLYMESINLLFFLLNYQNTFFALMRQAFHACQAIKYFSKIRNHQTKISKITAKMNCSRLYFTCTNMGNDTARKLMKKKLLILEFDYNTLLTVVVIKSV